MWKTLIFQQMKLWMQPDLQQTVQQTGPMVVRQHLFLMVDAARAKIIRIRWLPVGPGSMEKLVPFVQLLHQLHGFRGP